jgi:hypothetical protein
VKAFAPSTVCTTYNISPSPPPRLSAQILHPAVVEHRLLVTSADTLAYLVLDSRTPTGNPSPTTSPLQPTLSNTVKLELPSISSVHARGPVDTWYNSSHYAPKPALSSDRLPVLPQIQAHASGSSASSSPRGDSISSGVGSAGSNTSYAVSVNGQTAGFKTPSPQQSAPALNRDGQPLSAQSHQSSTYGPPDGYGYTQGYNSMNQMQSYADVHQPHMAAATHAPGSAPPQGMSHYAPYPPQSSMMQPGQQYGTPSQGYPPYGYGNGVPSQLPASSSMTNPMVPSNLQLPGKIRNSLHLNRAHPYSNVWCASAINSRCPELPDAYVRPHWSGRSGRDEAARDCHIVGR